jgi:hypothetical protein
VTTTEQVIDYNDSHVRRLTRLEAVSAVEFLTRIIADLDAGRVPSSNHARSAASALADVAHGVGIIATHDAIRKALAATEQES